MGGFTQNLLVNIDKFGRAGNSAKNEVKIRGGQIREVKKFEGIF